MKIAILVFPGLPAFEVGCATELFALSRSEFPNWYDGEVVSFSSSPLFSSSGMEIVARHIDSLEPFDMLVIPGWQVDNDHVKVSVAQQLVDFHQAGKRIVSFCSGSFLLAQLGILDGKQATTHWRYAPQFKQRFSRVMYVDNVLYTQQGNIFCSAGSASALDLGLEIIRQDHGHEIANKVARRLVIAPQRKGGQAQYVEKPVSLPTSRFTETLDWAVSNLHQPLSVDQLAQHANMSRRSFDRHFRLSVGQSPKTWLNQQRIEEAKFLLEHCELTMEQIAEKVGFENSITLRFNCQKYLGVSPSEYQAQFNCEQRKQQA